MNKRKLGFYVLAFLATAGIGYVGVTQAAVNADSPTQPEPKNGKQIDKIEAEAIVGYSIHSPQSLPNGLEGGKAVLTPGIADGSFNVLQGWQDTTGGGGIQLIQSENPVGLIDGKPVKIGGIEGQIVEYPADETRPFTLIVLSWTNGEIGYQLAAGLTGNITREAVFNAALSIK